MVEFIFESGEKIVLMYEDNLKDTTDPCNIFVVAGAEHEKMKFPDFVYHTAMSWKAGETKPFECILRIILKYLQQKSRPHGTIKTDFENDVSISHEVELSAEDDIKVEDNLRADDDHHLQGATEVSDDSVINDFKSQDNLNDKIDNDIICLTCRETFVSQECLVKHLHQIHKTEDNSEPFIEVKSSQTKSFQCGVCFKNLCSKNSLQVHVSTVHEKRKDFSCSKCPKTFSTNSHARKHLRDIHGEVLPNKSPLLKRVISKDSSLTCSECDKIFSCIQDNVLHVFNEHPQHPEYLPVSIRERGHLPWSRSSVWERPNWTCPVCTSNPIGCETLQGLVSHITQAHSMRTMCWVCGLHWPIEQVSILLAHMKKEHPIKSIWMCDQCGVYNQSLKHFNAHKKMVHVSSESVNAIHRCSECSYTTEKAASLRKHKSARHIIANRIIICTECGKVLSSKTALKCHASVHNKGNKHRCEICGKEFSQRGYLKTHLLSHTDTRPFVCEFCPMSFIGSCALTSHRRRAHSGDISEMPSHLCKQCDKKCWLPGDLRTHVRTVHEGRKDYECSECFKCFSTKKNVKRHKMNVHGALSLTPTC